MPTHKISRDEQPSDLQNQMACRFPFQKGEVIRGCAGVYRLKEVTPSGPGGKGETFIATVLETFSGFAWPVSATFRPGIEVIVKTPRIDWARDPHEIQTFIGKVNASLDEEINSLGYLHDLNSVAKTLDSGTECVCLAAGVTAAPRFLIQEHIEGLRLDKYAACEWPSSTGDFRGVSCASQWFCLANDLVQVVKEIHQRGVCHKDIWPRNIIMRGDRPVLIDFGEAAFRQSTCLKRDLWEMKPHSYMAPENRRGERWPTRRADLYSIGGVLYWLAVGSDPPLNPNPDRDQLKLEVTEEIKRVNPKLISDNCAIADIIARCLRFDRNQRVLNAERLLQEIRTFSKVSTEAPCMLNRIKTMTESLQEKDPFFSMMAELELRELECRIQDMTRGIVDVHGGHEEITSAMTKSLSVLGADDEYVTATVPQFWFPDNLGVNGRYLTMNRQIAEKGARIRRLFLLTAADRKKGLVHDVLRAHIQAYKELSLPTRTLWDIRFRILTEDERLEAIRSGFHCGSWIRSDQSSMTIIPVYDSGVITTVRFRSSTWPPKAFLENFRLYFEKAQPLEQWFVGN